MQSLIVPKLIRQEARFPDLIPLFLGPTRSPAKGTIAQLFARAASCDVTPREPEVRLAGYASRRAPASRILDPIEISALLLECGETRCLIFSFDLMIVGSELAGMIRSKLLPRGFEAADIVLLASHTHTAPATDRACAKLGPPDPPLVEALAEAAESLVRRMDGEKPSQIDLSLFQGRLHHSINRRRFWPFPTVGRTYGFRLTSFSMAPNPSGPVDERATVALLRRTSDDKAVAVLWHYTCHPTAVVPENVVSADYPGAVRQALRERFGDIPCIFVQGFCGDIRPDMASSLRPGWRERLRQLARRLVSGPGFAACTAEDWTRWSQSMAAGVRDILTAGPSADLTTDSLQRGSASLALDAFLCGSKPDKDLAVQIVRIGQQLEIVALSAEVTVPWQGILDTALPPADGVIRLHAGYAGALFGYLPTAAQIPEGGYEVEGFQPLFGLSGHFKADRIEPAVIGCVRRAFDDLESRTKREQSIALAAESQENR
jgi:hypothetical protein